MRGGDAPEVCVRLALKDSEEHLKDMPASRSVPGIARQIVDSVGVCDGDLPVGSALIKIESLEEFEANVVGGGRRLPFLLFGFDAYEKRGAQIEKLAAKLAGVTHTGVLAPEASWAVTQHRTRRFTVFGDFAKLYYPIPNPAYIEPLAHPLINLELVTFDPVDRFASHIIGACQKYRHPEQTDLPRFLDISARVAESSAVVSDPADRAQIEQLQSIIEQQREDLENFEELFGEVTSKEREQEQTIAVLERKTEALEERLQLMTDFLKSLPDRAVPAEPPPLRSLEQIGEWCELAGAGHLELSKEFLKTFEDAPEDGYYLYRVALALHGIAQLTAGNLYMTGRNIPLGQGVELCPIGDTQGFDYSFVSDGCRYVSDWHAKWGNGRDIRAAFRIYYFWNRDEEKAVLHCFTTHLDNKSTN